MADIFVAGKKEKGAENNAGLVKKTKGRSYGPLASFCHFPSTVKFISKDTEEEIVLFLRRHWVTNTHWLIISIILLFAPIVLINLSVLSFLPDSFQLITVAVWYLVVVAYILESFLNWFFNVCIVTDERVFDVDFMNLIYREITDANLDQIQDVTVTMGGVFRTIFNYGDVIIQTAGEIPRIEFTGVPNPDKVAKILRELRIEEEKEKMEGRVR